jgi:DNA-binding NarL/FixJ family response regulator
MQARRVVLLNSRSLLAAGVQSLLQEIDGLEVYTVSADDPQATAKIRQLAPGAIVLDSGDVSLDKGVITRMLEDHPKAEVIALSLSRADIEVYRIERLLQTDLCGLLRAIRGSKG